jgi:mannose-6-phosphate isomerase-like protein (cupin superfamily)
MRSYPLPKYHGPGEVSAVLHRAGQRQPDVEIGNSARIFYLATGDTTGGAFCAYLSEFDGPDPGAAPHIHTSLTESFLILEGTMQLYTGAAWVDATRDDWMTVPEGGIHGFRHQDPGRARILVVYTPDAPREEFFEGLAALAAGRPLPYGEALPDFMRRHDNRLLGPAPA